MLENIIGQEETVTSLRKDFQGGCLAPSLLFYGPPYSGKLSTALEIARVLSCETGPGDWGCTCSACRQHRLLVFPGTLIVGVRDHQDELLAAASALIRTRKDSVRYLFVRTVRKNTRPFDPVLWRDETSQYKMAAAIIAEIEPVLGALEPGVPLADETELRSQLDDICGKVKKLVSLMKTENIPINQIRSVSNWVHLSSGATRKCVILENLDKVQEASRNALLKILEEPPGGVFFILLTNNKGLIASTILSRLRPYTFVTRSDEDQHTVMRKIFHELSDEYNSLRDFFLAWREPGLKTLRSLANRFVRMLTGSGEKSLDWFDEIDNLYRSASGTGIFVTLGEELLLVMRTAFEEGHLEGRAVDLGVLDTWCAELHRTLGNIFTFNQNPVLALEGLYYRLREPA